jgi:hypothetical protein
MTAKLTKAGATKLDKSLSKVPLVPGWAAFRRRLARPRSRALTAAE